MARLIARTSLAAWLVIGATLVIVLGLSVVVWRADAMMRAFALERFKEQLRDDNLTLRDRITDLGPLHVVDGKLFAGNAGAAELQDLLERTRKSIGRTSGIMLGMVRVASSSVKPDGTHPIGEALNDPWAEDQVLRQGHETFSISYVAGSASIVAFQPLRDRSGAVIGMVTIGSPMAFVDAMAHRLRTDLLVSAGAAVVLGLALLWVLVKVILRPVGQQATVLRALADGQTDLPVPGLRRTDALGAIARAVVTAQQAVARNRSLEAEAEAARTRAGADKQAALNRMADSIETETATAITAIGASTKTLSETADAMTASATDTGEAARAAARAADLARANAQSVAGAAEQLAGSIREIGVQVEQSTSVVKRAVTAGEETRATMAALNEKVGQIGAVADMIGEIAGRTNLLALNATIEAARAGDAGRGFAVVASEVKALATQTARSTDEIARHIAEVRTATATSVAAVGRIEQTIHEINAIASSIAAAIEQQGAATAEIARNVVETAKAADEMTSRTDEVSAEASRTGGRADTVSDLATALHAAVGELRACVIRVVRTATPEVDRRRSRRYEFNLPCRVSVRHEAPVPARLVDLSEGGARLRQAGETPLSIPSGTSGTLDVDGVGVPLPFTAHAAHDGTQRLAFRLDQASEAALKAFLGRTAVALAA